MMDPTEDRVETALRNLRPRPLSPEAALRMQEAVAARPHPFRYRTALAAAAAVLVAIGAGILLHGGHPDRDTASLDIDAIMAERSRAVERAEAHREPRVLPEAPRWSPGERKPGS